MTSFAEDFRQNSGGGVLLPSHIADREVAENVRVFSFAASSRSAIEDGKLSVLSGNDRNRSQA